MISNITVSYINPLISGLVRILRNSYYLKFFLCGLCARTHTHTHPFLKYNLSFEDGFFMLHLNHSLIWTSRMSLKLHLFSVSPFSSLFFEYTHDQ